MISGQIFNLQKFSTDDGPGIRTTVFLKGCPLRCAWCHNPEGMRAAPDLMWHDARCIGARDCLDVCPKRALRLSPQGLIINRERCNLCGECALKCPSAALEIIGKCWTPDNLLEELLKDKVFYETSGGGVTFSGGEPMNQVDFLCDVLPMCKQAGLHIALDTCGATPWERYERLLSYIDLVLLDLKIMDAKRHLQAVGVSNELVLDNARRFAEFCVPMWVRTPIIPGYTDDLENVAAIGSYINSCLPTVERWDLLAYTNLGKPKYHRLDLSYKLKDVPLLHRHQMETVHQQAIKLVPTARWSGVTQA